MSNYVFMCFFIVLAIYYSFSMNIDSFVNNAIPIDKRGTLSPNRVNCHPISIPPILSKVYEMLVSHKLFSFCEKYVFFLLLSLLIGKVWAALMHC